MSTVNFTVNNAVAPVKIFISYAHKDEELRKELDEHLSNLQRQKLISGWHDRQIVAGQEWATQIDEALNEAQIILLLISSSFINSDYCYAKEMLRAIERHEAKDSIVIPIILRDCDWQGAPFSKLQALPKNAKPIKSWPDRDEAWTDVARGIRRAVEEFARVTQFPSGPTSTIPDETEPLPQFDSQHAITDLKASNKFVKPPDVTKLPALLPYLCDRSQQEAKLMQALRQHRQAQSRRPVVCLLHGNKYESHVEFLDRMRKGELEKALSRTGKPMEPKEFSLREPQTAFASPPGFWWELAVALGVHDTDYEAQEACLLYLKQNEEPLIVTLELSTKLFKKPGADLLKGFLQACEAWEDLPPNRALLLCVCFHYEPGEQPRWFDFKLKQQRQAEEQLQQLLRKLEEDFSAHPKICGVALPELLSLAEDDIYAWHRKHQISERYQIKKKWLEDLFANPALCRDGRIPMRIFAEQLDTLMQQRLTQPSI